MEERARPIYFVIVREKLRYCSRKTHFQTDYFAQVKSYCAGIDAIDAVRNPAKITPVSEAANREFLAIPVGGMTALLPIIGLVLIGDIVARCGPPT